MNIVDAYSHPLFNPEPDKRLGYHTRNILCCAISDTNGRSIAVLQVRLGTWVLCPPATVIFRVGI